MNLFEHFRIIWRRRWIVLGVAVVTALATFGWFKAQAAVYQATAQVAVTPGQTSVSTTPGSEAIFLAATYAQLATTRPVIAAAVKSSKLDIDESTASGRIDVSASSTLGIVTVQAKGPTTAAAAGLANAEVAALTDAVDAQQVEALQAQLAKSTAQAQSLSQQIAAAPSGSVQQTSLQQALQALQTVTATQQSQPLNQVNTVAPANAEGGPVSPKPTRDALLAFLTALVLAAEGIVLIEAASDRFPSDRIEEEVSKATGLPVLARVPDGEANVIEAFRKLRTSLQFMDDADGLRTVAVASSDPSAGKSFVATHLATAVAEAGQPVVLVDADTRRPVVHERLRIPRSPGLTNVLLGASVLTSLATLPRRPTMQVLAAGEQVADPSGLFSRMFLPRVVRPLAEDRLSSDGLIVVDTPPESLFPDVLTIAAQCDGAIVVIDVKSARRRAVRRTVDQLRQVGANPLGVVLNRAPDGTPGGGRYGRYGTWSADDIVEAATPTRRVKNVPSR